MTTQGSRQDSCPLCGNRVESLHSAQPGYRLDLTYEIRHCPVCDTSFAHPLEVDSSIYDAIYAHASEIPGYDRYAEYAKAVLEVADPLGHLAGAEDVYWSIRSCLEQVRPGARILDVGSGLGYLTYALAKSGHDVTGIDISTVAVANANQRYGPYYQEADLADWSVRKAGEFDLVVMAELLEHIPDPAGFLDLTVKLLRPGGRLVVTTPNKSYFPAQTLWETEAPPVHLWWFSESSMRALAKRMGLGITFVDFAPFNRLHPNPRARVIAPNHPSFGAMLDGHNRPLSQAAMRQEKRKRRPSFYRLRRWATFWAGALRSLRDRFHPEPTMQRRTILCAVMSKPDPSFPA